MIGAFDVVATIVDCTLFAVSTVVSGEALLVCEIGGGASSIVA